MVTFALIHLLEQGRKNKFVKITLFSCFSQLYIHKRTSNDTIIAKKKTTVHKMHLILLRKKWVTGIYQAHQPIEVSGDTTTGSVTSAQQQKFEESSRLSGSEIKSSGFISSSSLAIASIGGGSQSVTPSGGTNSNAGSGDSPTPTQHRRLAKSFSVAPSLSQTTKGW